MLTEVKNMTARQAAKHYMSHGSCIVPIPPKSKGPVLDKWQTLRITESDIDRFISKDSNIGIILGQPSNWLIDVDIDCDEAMAIKDMYLPHTGIFHGRASKPKSHYWYKCEDAKTAQFKDPVSSDGGAMLIELRSTGAQTVVPPSIHPSDEVYIGEGSGEVSVVDCKHLHKAVSHLGAASLLARYWSEGKRHAAALALSGTFYKAGWSIEESSLFMEAVCTAAHDPEIEDRMRAVTDTYHEGNSGQPIISYSHLCDLFSDSIIKSVTKWLCLNNDRTSPFTSRISERAQTSHPRIVINERQHRDIISDILRNLLEHNTPTRLYDRDGKLVQVVNQNSRASIQEVSASELHVIANNHVDFVKSKQRATNDGGLQTVYVDTSAPSKVLQELLSSPLRDVGFPALQGVVHAPVILDDGTIECSPGYLPHSKLYYDGPSISLKLPETSRANVKMAKSYLLDHLLAGFPFKNSADKAHAICALLQPLIRNMIEGPTPMYLIGAPTRGTGKTLLGETLARFGSPRGLYPGAAPKSEDEWRKRITSTLRAGSSVVMYDNLEGHVRSESLAIALTSETWTDRLLGQTEEIRLPNRTTWYATANNANMHEDLVSRTVYIELDAGIESPEMRRGFKIQNPPAFVTAHHSLYLDTALILVRRWIEDGKPDYTGSGVSRYSAWSRVMGGILDCCEIPGFLENRERLLDTASNESESMRQFVIEWANLYKTDKVCVAANLYELACGKNTGSGESGGYLSECIHGKAPEDRAQKLGYVLRKYRDRVFAGWRIKCERGKTTQYYLERI